MNEAKLRDGSNGLHGNRSCRLYCGGSMVNGLVGQIISIRIIAVETATMPLNPELVSHQLISHLDPASLNTTQGIQITVRQYLAQAKGVHVPSHANTSPGIAPQFSLTPGYIGAIRQQGRRGITAHAISPDRRQQGSVPGQQAQCIVRHGTAWYASGKPHT